jgi:hypothetical protein
MRVVADDFTLRIVGVDQPRQHVLTVSRLEDQ